MISLVHTTTIVILREGGVSSIPHSCNFVLMAAAYWIPLLEPVIGLAGGEARWRAMTTCRG